MKQRVRKRRIATSAIAGSKREAAPRKMTEDDRAALRWISESGLFSLEASRHMYAGVRRLRPASDDDGTTMDGKP